MSTSFPTSKDTFANPTGTSDTSVVDHAAQHANANDAIKALEDVVGYTGDTSTTHTGKLSDITGSDVAVGKSATQTLSNKTLVAPIVNGTSGNLTISASTDGGEYNLNASVSGTLAVYGAGGQTLHLNLLDGDFKTNSTTRLTNAGVLQNVSLDGGSNTFTNIPVSAMASEAWTNYTPTLSAAAGSPSLGNGTLTGRYQKVGRRVTVFAELVLGSTTNIGTTSTRISLPFTPAAKTYGGICRVVDASLSQTYVGWTETFSGNAYVTFTTHGATADVNGTAPMTWATSDILRFELTYEAAS